MICKKCLADKEENEFKQYFDKNRISYKYRVCNTCCYVFTDNAKCKMSLSHIGLKQSEETKNKKNLTLKNVIHNKEWNKRVSLGNVGKHLGKKTSIETRQKQSLSHKGKKHTEEHKLNNIISWTKNMLKNGFISNPEKTLASALANNNIKFVQQYPIRGIPDFFIEPNICVFCDGVYFHGNKEWFKEQNREMPQKIINRRRGDFWVSRYLENSGYIVLRFWETDILSRIEQCVEKIKKVINSTKNTTTETNVILLDYKSDPSINPITLEVT